VRYVSKNPEFKVLREEDLENKVCIVIGTRPGIIMFSPIIRELERRKLNFFIIHTGQHYSYNMDCKFFEDLKLKGPQYRLDTVQYCKLHGEQTAEMLKGCEHVLLKERPKIVLAGGDANTNLAGALAARKLHISVGHVEAGERSGDWRMPEEHNRVMIDHISEYLFTTNEKGKENLVRDNVKGQIFVTGNPIVDAAYQNLEIALKKQIGIEGLWNKKKEEGDDSQRYCLATIHREENVDYRENLAGVLEGLNFAAKESKIKVVLFAHPRTLERIKQFGLDKKMEEDNNIKIEKGVGYLRFLNFLSRATLVLTDSGGVQQEACILKTPCVTLRENTEWVETLDMGCNILAGTNPERISKAAQKMMKVERDWKNPFGDGKAAEKIVKIIISKLKS
jgi:UDP-N-acetylglucosamine 2-epimerase (non-hydrolysing)